MSEIDKDAGPKPERRLRDMRNRIRRAGDEREQAVSEYLRAKGWKYTCEIAAHWLWIKEIKGRAVAVDPGHALQIQDFADAIECPDDDGDEDAE